MILAALVLVAMAFSDALDYAKPILATKGRTNLWTVVDWAGEVMALFWFGAGYTQRHHPLELALVLAAMLVGGRIGAQIGDVARRDAK